MAVIRVCALCESSCPDEHVYNISKNLTLHICENCWTMVRAIVNERLKENGVDVKAGVFGAHMEVGLVNDGPVTIIL